jgi:hypothetical protein
MKKYRFHFIFAASFGVGVMLLCWLLLFVLRAPEVVQSGVTYANIVPVYLSAYSQILSVGLRGWVLLLAALFQWFAVGFVLSLLFTRFRGYNVAA